jgi:adenosylmethionine-8-amino-7-oxononanoate aminotransferase
MTQAVNDDGHVFHRNAKATYPIAVRGDGITLIDEQGKRYIDASGGAAVSCLGHSDPDVRRAVIEQVESLAFAHTGFFSNQPMERLARRLAELAPGDLNRVYFLSGGSEAVEAALKMARQYWVEKGQPQRRHIIARRQSYHGNTLGALATGGNEWRREQFRPMLIETHHIAPCYAYRLQNDGESAEAYGLRAADELEQMIQKLGPETVCAFVAEPVVGATAGALTAAPGYFKRIREICDRYDVLLILDEVMCGMGRTGHLFACEADGIAPDLLTIAKGLGAGYQPIGALMVSERIYQTIRDGSGFFQHGHTYMGHATACAAAEAVLAKIGQPAMMAEVRRLGGVLDGLLRARFADHPHVGDIRGRGLFQALELVADRQTKAPFDPAKKVNAKVKAAAMGLGLMCYPMGGTIDGVQGDHILLAPPFICTDADLAEIVDRLAQAIDLVAELNGA